MLGAWPAIRRAVAMLMAKRPVMRTLRLGARVPATSLAARVMRLPTQMEAGNRERAALYRSRRWRMARDAFLACNPICCTPGCGQRAVIVDHRDGHQREDWRARFWDQNTWQPMCTSCHSAKSARELRAWRDAGEAIPIGDGGISSAPQPAQPQWGLHASFTNDIKGPKK